jgi:4-oxalomesaconate tautomerase
VQPEQRVCSLATGKPIQPRIPCMIIRGGTSKGAYFLADDLPSDSELRNTLILSIMGSPDPRQIDGIGGAHPLTSKVAIVSKSKRRDCDIDFLFGQVSIDTPKVDITPNCGNILAGVGPFAIERGLVKPTKPMTPIRVYTVNTGTIAELTVQTSNGRVAYAGGARIDGVPGTAAPISVEFLDAAGSVCGSLLPAGNIVSRVCGVDATLVDNGMPVVVLDAAAVGRTGYEPRDVLNVDAELKTRLEEIRLEAGKLMGLEDVSTKVVPKIALVAPPIAGGHVCTRSFIPRECHTSIGVFAAISVATACVLPGSPASRVAAIPPGREKTISVEHPTGELSIHIEIGDADVPIRRASLLRTARLLFEGYAFAHEDLAILGQRSANESGAAVETPFGEKYGF